MNRRPGPRFAAAVIPALGGPMPLETLFFVFIALLVGAVFPVQVG